ncbi:Tripartite DNA replication factor [Podochytrium sp. JEL0797]|nr:Tripartite DNA replication factor [Podochytrium sp. JEL0797]
MQDKAAATGCADIRSFWGGGAGAKETPGVSGQTPGIQGEARRVPGEAGRPIVAAVKETPAAAANKAPTTAPPKTPKRHEAQLPPSHANATPHSNNTKNDTTTNNTIPQSPGIAKTPAAQSIQSCSIFWKNSPPIEKLKSFVKTTRVSDPENDIRNIANSLRRVDNAPTRLSTNDMLSELWNQSASTSSASNSAFILHSKSPKVPATTPHSKRGILKRSQSSSFLSEGSPFVAERRAKRQHWASISSSSTSSASESTQGLKKLAALLGSLEQSETPLPPPKQPFLKIPTKDLLNAVGSTPDNPFRTTTPQFGRSKSSVDVRRRDPMDDADEDVELFGRLAAAPDFPDFSSVQASRRETPVNLPSVERVLDEKENAMGLAMPRSPLDRVFEHARLMPVILDKPIERTAVPVLEDDEDDEFGDAFSDDDMALLTACHFAEEEFRATQGVLKLANLAAVNATTSITESTQSVAQREEMEEHDEFDIDFDDLSGIDVDGMMMQAEKLSATMGVVVAPKIEKRVKFERLIVLETCFEQNMVDGFSCPEQVLRLFNERTNQEKILRLREDWYQTNVEVGSYVHFITDSPPPPNPHILTNHQNFLITNPDTLISATHVADSFDCLRKSVFQDMCRVSNESNSAMVYGKLLHEIFQACVLRRDFAEETIEREVEVQVARSLEELWSIGETEGSARQHLRELVPNLMDWDAKYGREQPYGPIEVFRTQTTDKTIACVSNTLDIEEHIWSPIWGIKGNIDASLEVKTQTGRNGPVVTHIMPLELKTGKSTTAVSHRAQASLYTLMMQDRYDVDVHGSLLYYLKPKEMIKIPFIRDEIRGLLINRNHLASAITSRKLPEMVQNVRKCTHCYSLNTCLVYHKAVENGDASTSGLGSLFEENTKDMTAQHAAFFKKWEALLTKEEGDIQTMRKEVWTLGAEEREKAGSCLSGMTVVKDEGFSEDASKIQRFSYTLKKSTATSTSTKPVSAHPEHKSFLNFQLSVGDPIVVSSETGHYALAIGFITTLDPDSITVSVDRRLKGIPKRLPAFDEHVNQVYGTVRMDSTGTVSMQGVTPADLASAVYRIDKDEFSAGMALVRGNLTNLFIPQGDEKRRRLVVDLEAPTFRAEEGWRVEGEEGLNVDQRKAMGKVLTANDYALILGMPGS